MKSGIINISKIPMIIKQNKIKFAVIIVLLFSFSPGSADLVGAQSPSIDPALLFFQIDKTSYFDPGNLRVDVVFNASTTEYNLLDLNIRYDSTALTLIDSIIASTCPLLLNENINNKDNNYPLTCASPAPLSGQVQIVRLVFKKNISGFTKLSFNNAGAYLANGLGDFLSLSTESHNIYINK
jgi:hypothetical protein